MNFEHVSVLLNECIEGLNIKSDGVYVDCTLGGGGHSSQIVKRLSDNGMLIGIDQDSNQSHQFAQVAALAVLFQGSAAGKALDGLDEQAGRTSMDAAGILNSILEFLHNHFLLT